MAQLCLELKKNVSLAARQRAWEPALEPGLRERWEDMLCCDRRVIIAASKKLDFRDPGFEMYEEPQPSLLFEDHSGALPRVGAS